MDDVFISIVMTQYARKGRCVQIGAVCGASTFESKIYHENAELTDFFIQYHGLTAQLLNKAPCIDTVTDAFCDWVASLPCPVQSFVFAGDGMIPVHAWLRHVTPDNAQRLMNLFPQGFVRGKELLKKLAPGRITYHLASLYESLHGHDLVGGSDALILAKTMQGFMTNTFLHYRKYVAHEGWCTFFAKMHVMEKRFEQIHIDVGPPILHI
jgi:hypothetical protein